MRVLKEARFLRARTVNSLQRIEALAVHFGVGAQEVEVGTYIGISVSIYVPIHRGPSAVCYY